MSGGGSKQTTTNSIPKELRPLATAYAKQAMQLGNAQFTPYTGQRFAGLNTSQNSAGDFYKNMMSSGTNPYLDQMVGKAQSNLVDNYQNTIMPQLDMMRARSGSFGNSGIDQTMQRSQKDLMNQLSDVSTQMYGGQYNADQARRFEGAQGLMGFGAMQQQAAQNPLDFAFQQFQEQQNQPYKNLQVMGAPFSQNMGSTQTTSQQNDPLQSLLGTALLAKALIPSDRRLKTDIKKVGKTDGGQNVYTYKYGGEGPTHMGVMAQEVMKDNPEAVGHIGKFLAVDYSKVK